MDFLSTHSSLSDILHALAQALLVPDIILLLLFAGYALFSIGSILVEFFTERKHFKVSMPSFLSELMAAEEKDIPEIIRASGLLNRQKTAMLTVYDHRTLPGDALLALIRRLVHTEETHYTRISGRNNTAAKISPMLGLMGTLIPLGPGVAALGQADTSTLSSSLLVAFDTTVAGLMVAAICLAVGKVRSIWYDDYLSALDSGMATMLEKIEELRRDGKITIQKPTNYAFMFEDGLKKSREKTPATTSGKDNPATTGAHAPISGAASTTSVPTSDNTKPASTASWPQAARSTAPSTTAPGAASGTPVSSAGSNVIPGSAGTSTAPGSISATPAIRINTTPGSTGAHSALPTDNK